MIGVIITLVVCITIGVIASIRMNREMDRIKELEDRLDEYYKQREQRLLDNKKIIEDSYRGGGRPVVRIKGSEDLKK